MYAPTSLSSTNYPVLNRKTNNLAIHNFLTTDNCSLFTAHCFLRNSSFFSTHPPNFQLSTFNFQLKNGFFLTFFCLILLNFLPYKIIKLVSFSLPGTSDNTNTKPFLFYPRKWPKR